MTKEPGGSPSAHLRRLQRWFFSIIATVFVFISIWCLLQRSQLLPYKFAYTTRFNGYYRQKLPSLLDKIDIDCDGVISGNLSVAKHLKTWNYSTSGIEATLNGSSDKCQTIKELFSFNLELLSQEEADFPLAYGMVVYKDIVQILFQLSAFYHPQNEYCIAVSGSAAPVFKEIIHYLPSCFPNIHILDRPPISWGSFEIINSTYSCLEMLSRRDHPWRYYQYLSGVDLPLKTNLEMVKIFKALNGNANVEFSRFQESQLQWKYAKDSPLPLFKSSLSVLIPRAAANFIISGSMTDRLLEFLPNTEVPDESFWATLMGNVNEFAVPGGIDAEKLMRIREKFSTEEIINVTDGPDWNYYISREQVWYAGKLMYSSCVYGVQDLPRLMKQPHLVAHKFYLDFQPAGYFCVLKEIRQRTLAPVPFDASNYSQLPQYELLRGVAPENLTHPSWLMHRSY